MYIPSVAVSLKDALTWLGFDYENEMFFHLKWTVRQVRMGSEFLKNRNRRISQEFSDYFESNLFECLESMFHGDKYID